MKKNRIIKMSQRYRVIAVATVVTMLYQIVFPTVSLALSGGPSAPEFSSFQQASTTDMVDLFSGDFKYNIPLFEIDGYPMNLSYSGNVGVEEEASWVGLGWNLSPGMINRSVRGIPDDFNGSEIIEEHNHRRTEKRMSFNIAIPAEIAGKESKGAKKLIKKLTGSQVDEVLTFNYSTRRGFYLGADLSKTINVKGVDIKAGVQYDAESGININSGITFSKAVSDDMNVGASLTGSIGYNSRSGLQNFGIKASVDQYKDLEKAGTRDEVKYATNSTSSSFSLTGKNSYFPSAEAEAEATSFNFAGKLGLDLSTTDIDGSFRGSYFQDKIKDGPDDEGTFSEAYGYLYLQEASENPKGLLDFNMDGDASTYYPGMEFLPPGALMYDVYTVVGQGFSGTIRPKRSETGAFSEPLVSNVQSVSGSLGGEWANGDIVKLGLDLGEAYEQMDISGWDIVQNKYGHFDGNPKFTLEKNISFIKGIQAGSQNEAWFEANGGLDPISYSISSAYSGNEPQLTTKEQYPSSDEFQRIPENEVLSYYTAEEAEAVHGTNKIRSYNKSLMGSTPVHTYAEKEWGDYTPHHITELTAFTPEGSRYVYGIPARNMYKKEITFNTSGHSSSLDNEYLTSYSLNASSIISNSQGVNELYFSKTTEDSYSYAHLITGFLGSDYVDVEGDGITDDDIGNAVKFNWTKTHDNYKWRSPMTADLNEATLNPGTNISDFDQTASIAFGKKELWYMHSIESKNQIAFFQISEREDGQQAEGIDGGISSSSADKNLYRLDKILIYSKVDWKENGYNATPIRIVRFEYSYELCPGTVNSSASAGGKLTLKKIWFEHGDNAAGALSPYEFTYQNNKPYDRSKIDRWGNYKSSNPTAFNTDARGYANYPYSNESDLAALNEDVSAWQLNSIQLPTGGTIEIEYESDSYAHVQDKTAQYMYEIAGLGSSNMFGDATNQLHDGTVKSSLDQLYIFMDSPGGFENVEDLFDLDRDLYFKVPVDIPSNQAENSNPDKNWEYIRGYCHVEEIGLCPDDANVIYLKLQPTEFDDRGNVVHPILKAALDYTFSNHQLMIFGGINPENSGIVKAVKNIIAIKDDIISFFTGPYRKMVLDGFCQKIKTDGSGLIRMDHPSGNKMGGGIRVKSIEMFDGWDDMTGGEAASYGQKYSYVDPETGRSSGVASFEPMSGNDENPFKIPYFYSTDNSNSKRPKPSAYLEAPVGELFFPSPSVGYSYVRVDNINAGKRSTATYSVNSFYTAKDFPTVVESTELQEVVDDGKPKSLPELLGYGTTEVGAATAQGHSIVLNDMHGKPKLEESYRITSGQGSDELISSTEYIYHTDDEDKLKNSVLCVNRDGTKEERTIGIISDIDIYSKMSELYNHSADVQSNLSTFYAGLTVLVIPPVWPAYKDYYNKYKTAVITKVTQRRGLIDRIVYKDRGLQTVVKNELFDSQSGEVLVTSTSTEFNNDANDDKIFAASFPAHFVPDLERMGYAYRNLDYRCVPDKKFEILTHDQAKNVLDETERDELKEFIFKGYIDGLKKNVSFYGGELFGNQVQAGVFVEGDEVVAVDPENTLSGKYTVSEVITEEQYDAINEITEVFWGKRNPLAYNTPGSVVSNPTQDDESFVPICGDKYVEDQDITEAYNFIAMASKESAALNTSVLSDIAGINFSAVESYTGDFIDEMDDAIWNEVVTANPYSKFKDIWTQTWSEDFYNYCSWILKNETLRERLASDYWNCAAGHYCNDVEAFYTVLYCEDLRNCLEGDLESTTLLAAMDAMTSQVNSGNISNLHSFLGYLAYGYDDHHFLVEDAVAFGGFSSCYGTSGSIGTGSVNEFPIISYGDFFELPHQFNSSTSLGYVPYLFDLNANANNGLWPEYDHIDWNFWIYNPCDPVSHETYFSAFLDADVQTCPTFLNVKDDSYANEGENPGINTDDPQDYEYNQPDASELVVFINELGNPVDLEGVDVRIIRSGRRNLQSAMVGSSSGLNIEPYSATATIGSYKNGYLSHSAQMFSDEWTSDFMLEGETGDNIHPFRDGFRGSFRPSETYTPRGYRTNENGLNAMADGRLIDVDPYWVFDVDDYNVITPSDATNNWITSETITAYSNLGIPVEAENALGFPSAELVNHNNSVVASAVNARHRDILYESFEKYKTGTSVRIGNLNGLKYNADNVSFVHAGSGNEVNLAPLVGDPHSGERSLFLNGSAAYRWEIQLEPPTSNVYDNSEYRVDGFMPNDGYSRDFVISMWLKTEDVEAESYDADDDIATINVSYKSNGSSTGSPSSHSFSHLGPMIDGWRRLEGQFTIPGTADELWIEIDPESNGAFIDDIRIYPAESSMKTFVYEIDSKRLSCVLDENNYGTFYRYKPDGSLEKIERETDRGRITLKESVKENAKL